MATKNEIDGVLQTWGDRLYSGRVKSTRGAGDFLKPLGNRKKGAGAGQAQLSANAVRQKLDATVKKRPEVMVKITGSGKHIAQIKNHLDYISRNGELALEDQDGEYIDGKEAVRDLRDSWKNGKFVIPTEEGKQRETFNIVLSMPAGTERQGVTNAARDFASTQFRGKHDYVFATHEDDDHPHIHLIVRARDYKGKRLNPRKGDLQKWRESFAEKLGEHGIEANATKRKVRGVTRRPVKKTVIEAVKRGVVLHHARDPQSNPGNPFGYKLDSAHAEVVASYGKIGSALAKSDIQSDKQLAAELMKFVQQMPIEQRVEQGRAQVLTSPSHEQQRIKPSELPGKDKA